MEACGRACPSRVEPLEVYDRRGDGHTVSRHCGTTPAGGGGAPRRAPLARRHRVVPGCADRPALRRGLRRRQPRRGGAVAPRRPAAPGHRRRHARGDRRRAAAQPLGGRASRRGRSPPCGWCSRATPRTPPVSPCSPPTRWRPTPTPILASHEQRRHTHVAPGDSSTSPPTSARTCTSSSPATSTRTGRWTATRWEAVVDEFVTESPHSVVVETADELARRARPPTSPTRSSASCSSASAPAWSPPPAVSPPSAWLEAVLERLRSAR